MSAVVAVAGFVIIIAIIVIAVEAFAPEYPDFVFMQWVRSR